MNRLYITFLLFFFLSIKCILAGDTIRVMQYNLLYYDKNTSFCTSTNNNVDQKDVYLKTITNHYMPDIFTVNEMNGSASSVDRILNNVFNIDGLEHYKRGGYTGSYLVNMLYYNSNKFGLKSQTYILTSPRITDVYQLYYKSESLAKGDTVFLTCIVTHLKAGNSETDREARYNSAKQIMAFIEARKLDGNIMFMGDFNVYNHQEPAFQEFITTTSTGVQFVDPIDALGNWHDNPNFAAHHTQSTHTSNGNSCPSGGGMDDRFDFILTSKPFIEGTKGIEYVDGSYWAFGQDGNRLNRSLVDPPNHSLPSDVIDALYHMSDHLPVVLKLYFEQPSSNKVYSDKYVVNNVKYSNPISDRITLWLDFGKDEDLSLKIFNLLGTLVMEKTISVNHGQEIDVNTSGLQKGIYLIKLEKESFRYVGKVVKN